jgi:hypothetical protein
MAAVQNASFALPPTLDDFSTATHITILDNVLTTITGLSGWAIALTVLLGFVAYDQCAFLPRNFFVFV